MNSELIPQREQKEWPDFDDLELEQLELESNSSQSSIWTSASTIPVY